MNLVIVNFLIKWFGEKPRQHPWLYGFVFLIFMTITSSEPVPMSLKNFILSLF